MRSRLVSRDHLDKAALVAAFLVGAVGSWGAKALGFGPFVAVAWTVGAMAFYVAAVTLLGRLRIEPEAIGDNCYYLGFLLTLSSLSATLYELARSEAQAELMRSIIGGFGIALVSTILGILLRVIFIQLRPDIVARDRETRIELQRAARELRLELAASVAAMKAFSTEAIQLAAEQGARARAAADAAAEAQAAMVGRTLEAAGAEAVRAIGASVSGSAEAAQVAIAGSLAEMSRAIGEFAAAQTAAVDAREANEARAEAAGDKALARTGAVADEVEALGARVAQALGKLARELGESAAAIEAAGAAAQAARARAEAAADLRPAARPFARWRG